MSEAWIPAELERIRREGLERTLSPLPSGGPVVIDGKRRITNLSSNDYLDLAHHPLVIARAEEALLQVGASASASRLVTGTLTLHEELEVGLGEFFGWEAALVFGSGALANLSVVSTLVGRGDWIIADKLVHATLLDGAVLSRAKLERFHHNDLSHLEELLKKASTSGGRVLVVTESVFSMDGDLAPVPEISALCVQYGAMLLVDEAHAVGVFGPSGRGVLHQYNSQDVSGVTVVTGTFSKAFGSYGGFALCRTPVRELLINRAREFIYTTALPPASVGAALGALQVLRSESSLGERLLEKAALFRGALQREALPVSSSQIVPIVVGDNWLALEASRRLRERGVLVIAIRSPTVPAGTARLRCSVSLGHTPEELLEAAREIRSVLDGCQPREGRCE